MWLPAPPPLAAVAHCAAARLLTSPFSSTFSSLKLTIYCVVDAGTCCFAAGGGAFACAAGARSRPGSRSAPLQQPLGHGWRTVECQQRLVARLQLCRFGCPGPHRCIWPGALCRLAIAGRHSPILHRRRVPHTRRPAGYKQGNEPLPSPPITRSIMEFDDGSMNDTAVIKAALDWANSQPLTKGEEAAVAGAAATSSPPSDSSAWVS